MPGEWDKLENMRHNFKNSVCINNAYLWWPLVLCLQEFQVVFQVWMWRICPDCYSLTPAPVLPDPPLWASSASWMTVSMWQSSLKWKRSRTLGVCASFTKLGFHQFHSVCQWLRLWTKAFETMPDSAVSDHWASSAFSLMNPKVVWHSFRKNSSRSFGDMKRKVNATRCQTLSSQGRWQNIFVVSFWFGLLFPYEIWQHD